MALRTPTARPDADLRAELFVRSLAPETARSQQETVIERLRNLETEGTLEALDVYVAGDCLCPSTVAAETETGQFLLGRVEQFEQWATENDLQLVGFTEQCVDSSLTGETVTGITVPRLCLAFFEATEPVLVAPVADHDDQITVVEAVNRFDELVLGVA